MAVIGRDYARNLLKSKWALLVSRFICANAQDVVAHERVFWNLGEVGLRPLVLHLLWKYFPAPRPADRWCPRLLGMRWMCACIIVCPAT